MLRPKMKKLDYSKTEFLTIDEGLCVQIMHIGPFDSEPESVAIMDKFLKEQGYENDINENRLHHEIYMSDARKVAPEKWKTVIRHPIKRKKVIYAKGVAVYEQFNNLPSIDGNSV